MTEGEPEEPAIDSVSEMGVSQTLGREAGAGLDRSIVGVCSQRNTW